MIRVAKKADAPGIMSVQLEAWVEGYKHFMPESFLRSLAIDARITRWEELISSDQELVYVFEENGSIVGFTHFRTDVRADDSVVGEIERLYVHPEFWRKGIGKQLLEFSINEITNQGTRSISLWVAEENANARAFYEARGFKFISFSRRVDRFSVDGLHLPPEDLPAPDATPNHSIGEFAEVQYLLKM